MQRFGAQLRIKQSSFGFIGWTYSIKVIWANSKPGFFGRCNHSSCGCIGWAHEERVHPRPWSGLIGSLISSLCMTGPLYHQTPYCISVGWVVVKFACTSVLLWWIDMFCNLQCVVHDYINCTTKNVTPSSKACKISPCFDAGTVSAATSTTPCKPTSQILHKNVRIHGLCE